jgi:hypothetical protein
LKEDEEEKGGGKKEWAPLCRVNPQFFAADTVCGLPNYYSVS